MLFPLPRPLDAYTAGLLAAVVAVTLSAGLSYLGRMLADQPGLRCWVRTPWLMTLGIAAMGSRYVGVPVGISALVGSAALMLAYAHLWLGARAYCSRPARWWPVAAVSLPFLTVIGWYCWGKPDLGARVMALAAAMSLWDLLAAWELYRHGPAEVRTSCRIAIGIFLLDALAFAAVFFWSHRIVGDPDLAGMGRELDLILVEGIFSGIAWCLVFVFLIARRLIVDQARLARLDGLTGVLNRRAFFEEGERILDLCRRQRLPAGVLLLDLDHFKQLNDTWGHGGGDAVLRHFARLVQDSLRTTDLFGRYGGEEFCILLPGIAADHLWVVAERLRTKLERDPAPLRDDATIRFTASIGAVPLRPDDDAEDLQALVARADAALYRAKAGGRNRVEVETGVTAKENVAG